MTDAEYDTWLADTSATRAVLCELDYAGGTRCVANYPFISLPSDAAPNRIYDDLLNEAIDIDTRIDGLIGFGEITLIDDGSITDWTQDAWRGHQIRILLGGPEWPLDEFRLHAVGINGGIAGASRGQLSFEMIDNSAVFDEPIDTGQLPDDAGPVPLALGSVYNAPAFRSSTQTLQYTASFLPVTSLTPKDTGNPVPFTADYPNGRFTLQNATQAELTVDIEEQHNTPTAIIQWLADRYGVTLGDVEMPGYTVGLYYSSEISGTQILNELCDGLGAYWFVDQLGELIVRQRTVPDSADVVLFSDDIADAQIGLASTEPPWTSLSLRWGRNYAPLRQVAGVIEDNQPEQAARLKREWSESKSTQPTPNYPLAEEVSRDSCISNANDAVTERDRLLAQRSVRHDIYSIEAFMPVIEVSQSISVEHPRMAGKIGSIISVSRSPTIGSTTIGVWL